MTFTKKSLLKTKLASQNKLTAEEKYWQTVEAKSKDLIANLLEANLPINATPTNFDLEKSEDYRVLLREDLPQAYAEEELPSSEELAQEVAYNYLLTIVKRILADLSDYACHDSAYFDQLTE